MGSYSNWFIRRHWLWVEFYSIQKRYLTYSSIYLIWLHKQLKLNDPLVDKINCKKTQGEIYYREIFKIKPNGSGTTPLKSFSNYRDAIIPVWDFLSQFYSLLRILCPLIKCRILFNHSISELTNFILRIVFGQRRHQFGSHLALHEVRSNPLKKFLGMLNFSRYYWSFNFCHWK